MLQWFTPHDVLTYPDPFGGPARGYNDLDLDLGSSGVVLIPGTDLLVGGGKTGSLYVLYRGNLGGFRYGDDSQIVQTVPAGVVAPTQGFDLFRIYSSPVWWNNLLYVWPKHNDLVALPFVPDPQIPRYGQFDAARATYAGTNAQREREAQAGGYLSVSANGNDPNSAILWAVHGTDNSAAGRGGILHAFAANDLTHELWNSEMNATRDRLAYQAKFVAPTIANGKVYVPTFNDSTGDASSPPNRLLVYGLLNTAVSLVATSLPAVVATGAMRQITVTAKQSDGATTATNYRGAVHFTSTDSQATLPADYTFTATDNGTHTFDVTLRTGGPQSVTATDTTTGGLIAVATTTVLTVTNVSETAGPTEGGAQLTITGTGFQAGTVVIFGVGDAHDKAAPTVTVVNATTLIVTTPDHPAGAVTVKVVIGSEVVTLTGKYTYGTLVMPTSRPTAAPPAATPNPQRPTAPAAPAATLNPQPPRR